MPFLLPAGETWTNVRLVILAGTGLSSFHPAQFGRMPLSLPYFSSDTCADWLKQHLTSLNINTTQQQVADLLKSREVQTSLRLTLGIPGIVATLADSLAWHVRDPNTRQVSCLTALSSCCHG